MAVTTWRSFREILADSNVGAVAIAVLLIRSIESGVRGLGFLLFGLLDFVVSTVAIGGIPYGTFTLGQWLLFIPQIANLVTAAITLVAAFLLSRWVYGAGPLQSLRSCGAKIARTSDA